MVNEYEIKKQICDIGRRIYSRNTTTNFFAHLQVYPKVL